MAWLVIERDHVTKSRVHKDEMEHLSALGKLGKYFHNDSPLYEDTGVWMIPVSVLHLYLCWKAIVQCGPKVFTQTVAIFLRVNE